MASCGPSNAQDQLKGHIFRDASLQREHAQRAPLHQPQSFKGRRPDQSVAEFAAFNSEAGRTETGMNGFEPNFDHGHNQMPHKSSTPESMHFPPRPDVGYLGPPSALAPKLAQPEIQAAGPNGVVNPNNWAHEFQNLSLNDPRTAVRANAGRDQAMNVPFASSGYVPALYFTAPAFAMLPCEDSSSAYATTTYNQDSYSLPHNLSTGTANDSAAFEAVFADIEQSLKNLKEGEQPSSETNKADAETENAATASAEPTELNAQPVESLAEGASQREQDASSVAETIMRQINDNSSPDLMDKMKNSQFMTSMNKLRTKEVKINAEETKFVDTSGSVEAYELAKDATQDWPPQRERPSSSDAKDAAPIMAENMSANMETQQEHPHQRPSTSQNGLPILDDPDTYLRNIQKNLDPRSFQKSPYTSPLSEAIKLTKLPSTTSDWDEVYERWA